LRAVGNDRDENFVNAVGNPLVMRRFLDPGTIEAVEYRR
jgi:hypothetical protein